MKSRLLLSLILVSVCFACLASANKEWSAEQKRALIEECLANTNDFVINVAAIQNPHRGFSPSRVQALWRQASENGTIVYLYPDGSLQGFWSYKQNKQHGPARSWYANGRPASDEEYDHGKLLVGTYYDEDGKLLCGMTNGTGKQLVYYMETVGTPKTIDCSITEYRDGLKSGVETIYTDFAKKEKLSESHYRNGKQEGLQTRWDHGRKIEEMNFEDGLPDGSDIAWDSSGQTNFVGHYLAGKNDGAWSTFLGGIKQSETVYHTGNVTSKMAWSTNGVLTSKEFYTSKGMMAESYDYAGKQTGKVTAGNGILIEDRGGLKGFDIEVYKDGEMVEDRRLRLFAKLVPDDANLPASAEVIPFHLEAIVTDEPLKRFAATLHLPDGVTSSGNLSFAATNFEVHQFETFELKFPMPFQQWTGKIVAEESMELSDCSIQSQTIVLQR